MFLPYVVQPYDASTFVHVHIAWLQNIQKINSNLKRELAESKTRRLETKKNKFDQNEKKAISYKKSRQRRQHL